jgi:hypothetical protein
MMQGRVNRRWLGYDRSLEVEQFVVVQEVSLEENRPILQKALENNRSNYGYYCVNNTWMFDV